MTWGGPSLPSGLDEYDKRQEPQVDPVDDLSRFVLDRIREAETEPRIDGVPKIHHDIRGAIAYRYAGYVRHDMVAFRRVVRLYVDCAESTWPADALRAAALRPAIQAFAMRWEQHDDFREEWRL